MFFFFSKHCLLFFVYCAVEFSFVSVECCSNVLSERSLQDNTHFLDFHLRFLFHNIFRRFWFLKKFSCWCWSWISEGYVEITGIVFSKLLVKFSDLRKGQLDWNRRWYSDIFRNYSFSVFYIWFYELGLE